MYIWSECPLFSELLVAALRARALLAGDRHHSCTASTWLTHLTNPHITRRTDSSMSSRPDKGTVWMTTCCRCRSSSCFYCCFQASPMNDHWIHNLPFPPWPCCIFSCSQSTWTKSPPIGTNLTMADPINLCKHPVVIQTAPKRCVDLSKCNTMKMETSHSPPLLCLVSIYTFILDTKYEFVHLTKHPCCLHFCFSICPKPPTWSIAFFSLC